MSLAYMPSFSFIPFIVSEKIFDYFFRKFTLYVTLATNQIKEIGQKSIAMYSTTRGTTQ